MRVLVTGYRGYLGPLVVAEFARAGHEVVGLDTGFFEANTAVPREMAPGRVITTDLRRLNPAHLNNIDAIVHLAALSNDPMGKLDPALTHAINTEASLALAGLAKKAGIRRFAFASSCSLYGAAGDAERPLDETAPFNPVSAYAQSKVDTETGLRRLADKDFSPVYLRFATAFGASPRMRLDIVVNNLMAYARLTGEIRVMSDGTPWRPLVHVRDMAQGLRCAVEAPADAVHDRAFNIGRDDANYRVIDIAQAVAAQVPGAKLVVTGETGGDARSYRVDFSRARRDLPGFAPGWTLEIGCREIDDWLKAAEIGRHDFLGSRFIRLRRLEQLMAEGRLSADLHWIN